MTRTTRSRIQNVGTLARACAAVIAFLAMPGAVIGQSAPGAPVAPVAPVAPAPQAAAMAEIMPEMLVKAQLEGRSAAMNAGGWFGRSVAIGAVTGLIGTAVTVAVAGGSGVELPAEHKLAVARQPLLYQQTFEKSYGDAVRSKRKSSSWKGGLLGTAAFVVLLLSSSSGSAQ